jgi:hypothetical protein
VCADPLGDGHNCGGCGHACATPNGVATCVDGACAFACAAGFARCSGDPGCDTHTNTTTDCGACGRACDASHAAQASCDGESCAYVCAPGWADCFAAAPDLDGCESDLGSPRTCGGCGKACDTARSVGASCVGGCCKYLGCSPGWGDCQSATPDLDGCETPLDTVTDCAACDQACDTTTASSASCDGATCAYVCRPGRADCNRALAPDLDGCETDITTTANCGGCGNACDTRSSIGAACSGATCVYTGCAPGRSNCNAAAPDVDGCECASPGCCGTACQSRHDDGLGQTFWDCTPSGTYNQTEAFAACAAFTGNAALCSPGACNRSVCSTGAPTCACWTYSGSFSGRVTSSSTTYCMCNSSGAAIWN